MWRFNNAGLTHEIKFERFKSPIYDIKMDKTWLVVAAKSSRITLWDPLISNENRLFVAKSRSVNCMNYRFPYLAVCYSNNKI